MAVASKMFPDRNLFYILPFTEPITTRSLSESTYDPSDPSLILSSDKNGILIWNETNKIERLSKVRVFSDSILFALFVTAKS